MWECGVGCKGWVAQDIGHGVVREEGSACIGYHAQEGGREAAEEVCQSCLRDALLHDRGRRGAQGVRRIVHRGCSMLVVNQFADASERTFFLPRCFKRQPDSDDFEGVCEEYRYHACETAAYEPPSGSLVGVCRNENGADLVVGEEFYACVGEDAKESCGVALEEAADAVLGVDVAESEMETRPMTGIFYEGRIARLEEDFDAVEGADYGFGLCNNLVSKASSLARKVGYAVTA